MGHKKEKIILVGLFFSVALIYSKLLNGFFQQDEWFSFTIYLLHRDLNFVDMIKFLFASNIGHYNPLTNGVQQILFSLWGMDYTKFAALGIVLHSILVGSVFFLGKLVFKGNTTLAFVSALLFGISGSIHEGTSWVVADISTLTSSFLGVVSAIYLFKFLNEKEGRYLNLSLSMVVVSLFFKEITIGLLPLFFIVVSHDNKKRILSKHTLLIVTVSIAYILLRASMLFGPNIGGDELVTQSQPIAKLVYNFITIPFKALSQTIFPYDFIRTIAERAALLLPEKITGLPESPEFDIFVVKRVMEFFSVSVGLFIPFISAALFLRKKATQLSDALIFSLGWVLLNSFVFAFAPEQPNVIFAVDSRNLYFTAIGASIFLVWVIKSMFRENLTKVILFFIPLLVFNVYWLNKNLSVIVKEGKIRKEILNQITTHYPNLPERTIFYTESDSSFYGLPDSERIFPFQSGFGQTLLVWYFEIENFPDEFYKDKFLWGITEEGYKEADGRGFGYFRNYESMVKEVMEKNLTPEAIISFRYDSEIDGVIDNTQEVRGRLLGSLSKERKIQEGGLEVTPSLNTVSTRLMLDNNRLTHWGGEVPYNQSQNIVIDLNGRKKVSSVELDSYDNRDQNGVGFEIFLSDDGKNWKVVFYSQVYPPPENGLNRLYFEPQFARFLQIKQIGSHDFAEWVIHEIDIYEAVN